MSMATTATTRRPRVNLAVVAPIVALIVLVLIIEWISSRIRIKLARG